MSMALIPPAVTKVTVTCSWRGSASTTTRPQVRPTRASHRHGDNCKQGSTHWGEKERRTAYLQKSLPPPPPPLAALQVSAVCWAHCACLSLDSSTRRDEGHSPASRGFYFWAWGAGVRAGQSRAKLRPSDNMSQRQRSQRIRVRDSSTSRLSGPCIKNSGRQGTHTRLQGGNARVRELCAAPQCTSKMPAVDRGWSRGNRRHHAARGGAFEPPQHGVKSTDPTHTVDCF